ncbi:MAG: anaerobic ribonucleoside-triphosphate reductase activating protein [Spirochaetales bacterium]|nr:anaerobic ribonucleoside-triphosphate reductase activating protein [Spirochaetales bacterium]
MLIGALQRFSLLDYPGKISCIVFTQGCNFRCPYCHNPELVDSRLFMPKIMPQVFFSFLEKRIKKIDAVVITGGEPTIQSDLPEFIRKIKALDFLVKLDTNGSRPEVLSALLDNKLLDYIAMDIKAPLDLYGKISGVYKNGSLNTAIRESIDLIINSEVEHEFRTTIVKDLLSKEHILNISGLIPGAKKYVLQNFVPSKTLDHRFMDSTTFSQSDLDDLTHKLKALPLKFEIR